MKTATQIPGVKISSVNIEKRAGLGIKSGDTVRVWTKIEEKGKTRLQPFEGIVLARKHGTEPGATFTVRRVSGGYGIEKIFPLYSPMIDKIEIIKRSKVRRAKLYHIRKKAAREIKRQMRKAKLVDITTGSDMEEAALRQAQDEAAKQAQEEEQESRTQAGGTDAGSGDTARQEQIQKEVKGQVEEKESKEQKPDEGQAVEEEKEQPTIETSAPLGDESESQPKDAKGESKEKSA